MKNNLLRVVFYLLLFLVWQGIVSAGFFPLKILPGPAQVLSSLKATVADGSLVAGIWVSLVRLIGAYLTAVFFGILGGIFISRFAWMESTVGSLILGLQTLPTICWLPLAAVWFGASETAIFALVVMGGVLSVVLATEAGVRHVPTVLVRAARSMGASGFELYRRVILPAAFPAIISGLKQGWAFSWRTLMAAELLFGNKGLGYLLQAGRMNEDTSLFIAIILVLLIIGITVEMVVFRPMERQVRSRWGLS